VWLVAYVSKVVRRRRRRRRRRRKRMIPSTVVAVEVGYLRDSHILESVVPDKACHN
jgi:hypothetical protein